MLIEPKTFLTIAGALFVPGSIIALVMLGRLYRLLSQVDSEKFNEWGRPRVTGQEGWRGVYAIRFILSGDFQDITDKKLFSLCKGTQWFLICYFVYIFVLLVYYFLFFEDSNQLVY